MWKVCYSGLPDCVILSNEKLILHRSHSHISEVESVSSHVQWFLYYDKATKERLFSGCNESSQWVKFSKI